MADQKTDVVVCGAGPVGLLIAIQLLRRGIPTTIIDAADKASPNFPMYGRASTLFSRTLEMLDQLDLFDDMAQVGLISNRNTTFRDGKRVQGRGWNLFEDIVGTYFDFYMNIRLKYSEDVFREHVERLGSKVQAPVKLVGLELDENADDYKVTSTCATPDGRTFKIKSKYIVGSDGASSAVRKLAEIPFIGEEKEDHWVRIDAVVKTNMPDARAGLAALESKTHGQVLWVALDHEATRIGYVLSPELYAKYGKQMKKEDAAKEAQAALAPFELEFEQIDWHTVYVVKQFVAERFQDRERILLAGDAGHSHSSGSAQGMNTGVHDACALGWRLAGVIQGLYKPEVLATYSDERRASAQHLINNDKVVSAFISGHRPEAFKDRPEDVMVLLDQFLKAERTFTIGLGVNYAPNLLNRVAESDPPLGAIPGHIAPDVKLHKQGFPRAMPLRLLEITKYNGKFHILIFTGDVRNTTGLLKTLRQQVDKEAPRFQHAIEFRTIILGVGRALSEYIGIRHFGKGYWDVDRSAHDRYKISLEAGAIAVLRPDGILGLTAPLDGFDRVATYLDRLILPKEVEAVTSNGAAMHAPVGEMITLDENNLYYKQADSQGLPMSHEEGRQD